MAMRLVELSWMVGSLWVEGQEHLARRLGGVHSGRLGQSTVEYALVGALVVIAAAGALTLLGGEINTVFTRITTTLSSAASSSH